MFAPVYLDWNATAPLDPVVYDAMAPWLRQRFGNASSRHEYGRQAHAAIEQARAQVASACGAHASEVIFTSGGSESNNLFIKGAAAFLKPALAAVSAIEHPSISEPALQLRRQGWQVDAVAVDVSGRIDRHDWQRIVAVRPQMISVMLANNETGVLQDISVLAVEAARSGIWFHTDAVQALGKIPLNFRRLGVHAMTVSSHKIGGPLGVGALITDKRLELAPLIAGGGQERNLRSGTENVAAIVGFGVACERIAALMTNETARLLRLQASLEKFLRDEGCRIFSDAAPRLPNTTYFSSHGLDGETLVAKLDRAGFACASGSACSSVHPGVSRTLLAMGVSADEAKSAVRVSFGRTTTDEDIERFCAAYSRVRNELKNLTAMVV